MPYIYVVKKRNRMCETKGLMDEERKKERKKATKERKTDRQGKNEWLMEYMKEIMEKGKWERENVRQKKTAEQYLRKKRRMDKKLC